MTSLDREIVALQTWWLGEVQALTQKVMAQEEARQRKAKSKAEKQLGDYRTYNDVQDAYGCGVISARKRDHLFDLLEQSNVEPDALYERKLELLSELYQTAKRALEDHQHE